MRPHRCFDCLLTHGVFARAKFITGSVAALLQKPEGGDEWLLSLRKASYKEAVEALVSLPGIGPKVIHYELIRAPS